MVTQHRNARERDHARTRRWDASRAPSAARRPWPCAAVSCWISGGGRRKMIASGTMTTSCRTREADHGPAPAEIRDRALEDGRPDEAREIAAAGNQRQRRAAAAVEPAADIDEQRRVQPGVAEQAHEQAVAEIELPRRAERRNEQADGDHHRADDHGPADAVAVGEPAHQHAADARRRTTPATPRAKAPAARRRCRRRSPSARPR